MEPFDPQMLDILNYYFQRDKPYRWEGTCWIFLLTSAELRNHVAWTEHKLYQGYLCIIPRIVQMPAIVPDLCDTYLIPWRCSGRKFISSEWSRMGKVSIDHTRRRCQLHSICFYFFLRLELCDSFLASFFFSPRSRPFLFFSPHSSFFFFIRLSWWPPQSVLCPTKLSVAVSHTSTFTLRGKKQSRAEEEDYGYCAMDIWLACTHFCSSWRDAVTHCVFPLYVRAGCGALSHRDRKRHLTALSAPKNTFTLYHLISFFSLLFSPRSLATVYIFFVPAPCCVSLPSLFQWQAPPLSPCHHACHLGGKW